MKQRGWDRFLVLLLLVLAFLSASFLARNSDLWFHLATGRLLAEGKLSFGQEPFAYTTDHVYWANHSWLYDLTLYRLRERIGETSLVVLKALLVAALAGVLLTVRRREQSLLAPVFCTMLALLALSPRLLLQPACLSYLFLGLTFRLLWRPHDPGRPAYAGRWAKLLLLLLFALWVNLDEWFLLGPLLTTLFWLGERWRGERQTPGWLVLAAWAMCLLSPYTYRGFTLPAELSPVTWSSGLRDDARFRAVFASPWQAEYWHAAVEGNAAVVAYYLLTVLGLLSFVLHRSARLGWRLLIWLCFAALAAWQARTIPFFAVVAAPIMTLNLQEILTRSSSRPRYAESGLLRSLSLPAWIPSFLLACVLLALIFLSWPGWLAGYARQERRVAWGVQVEPSLKRAAETLHQWRRQNLLSPSEHVFAFDPDMAHYAVWFCPEEKHFFDHRYPLFTEAARDYETVCQAFLQPQKAGHDEDWRRVLRERGVSVVVLSDRQPDCLSMLLLRLGGDRADWTLLDVSGSVLIFGWNEIRRPDGSSPPAFNADQLVFGSQDEKVRSTLPATPEQGPKQLPTRRTLGQTLRLPPVQSTLESLSATSYLHYFQASENWQRQRLQAESMSSFAARLVGLSALSPAAALAASQILSDHSPLFARTERSSALPLLAIRAARHVVAVHPEDSNAWLRLGQAYGLLSRFTCEHSAEGMLPPLKQLRQVQSITALQQALRLDPDLEAANHELADLYGERNYLDVALEHRRQELQISRRAGKHVGETPTEYASRLELLEREIAKQEETLRERRNNYSSAARALSGERVQLARLALKLGLARVAEEEILLTHAELLGAIGIKLELELLLALGRTEDVRGKLSEKVMVANKHILGYEDVPSPTNAAGTALYPVPYHFPAYDWLRFLQTAAVGDYVLARESLRTIRGGLAGAHGLTKQRLTILEKQDAGMVGGLLSGPSIYLPAFSACTLHQHLHERTDLQTGDRVLRAQQADFLVLAGMLALEPGAADEARSAFAAAQKLCEEPSGADIPFAGAPIAIYYLGKLHKPAVR